MAAATSTTVASSSVVTGQPGTDYCSTDKSYYNVGDTITISGHMGASNPYYVYDYKPNGSVSVRSLGNGPGSFSIEGKAVEPEGTRRVELWMAGIEIFGGAKSTMAPHHDVTCNTFTVGPAIQTTTIQASQWGSYGTGPGQFSIPSGVAVDSGGNVYVTDTGNDRVEKFTATGAFISQWGTSGSGTGQFNKPWGVAIDASGNVYVTDTGNNRVEKFTGSGTFVSQWGSRGTGSGQFFLPTGVAVDSSGNVYVSDTFNSRVQKFSDSGSFISMWGSAGTGSSQLNGPNGIAVGASGNVYVADSGNYRVAQFSGSGTFVSAWGMNGTGPGQFSAAYGLAADPSGNIYVADGANNRVEKFTSSGEFLLQIPCPSGKCPSGSGPGQLNVPYGIAVGSGNLYITDVNNHRVTVFSALATETSTSSTQTSSTLMNIIQQNQILILGAAILLAAVIIAVTLRGRRKPTPTQPTKTGTTPAIVYCEQCGTQNPTTNDFCVKCGTKLH